MQEEIKELLESMNQKLDDLLSVGGQHQDFIPYEKAMELLDCSRQTLDRMRSDKLFQVYRLRGKGRLYVNRLDLMQLMKKETSMGDIEDSIPSESSHTLAYQPA
jgi:hypothetical protein